jgi:hypothetical protein
MRPPVQKKLPRRKIGGWRFVHTVVTLLSPALLQAPNTVPRLIAASRIDLPRHALVEVPVRARVDQASDCEFLIE